MKKIRAYLITNNGEGYSQDLGVWDNIEDVEIYTNALGEDCVLRFEVEEVSKSVKRNEQD